MTPVKVIEFKHSHMPVGEKQSLVYAHVALLSDRTNMGSAGNRVRWLNPANSRALTSEKRVPALNRWFPHWPSIRGQHSSHGAEKTHEQLL